MKLLSCLAGCLLSASVYAQYSVVKLDVNLQGQSNAYSYTSVNGKTYFIAEDSVHGREIWRSDGVTASRVTDMMPGKDPSFFWPFSIPRNLLGTAGGKLYFQSQSSGAGNVVEIWQYDGINPPGKAFSFPPTQISYISQFIELNGELYFKAESGITEQNAVYRFTPSASTCAPVSGTVYALLQQHEQLVAVNGKIVFLPGGGIGTQPGDLQVYDAATHQISGVEVTGEPSLHADPASFYVHNNVMYFLATSVAHGTEMYRYDGLTPPKRITDIVPGSGSSFYCSFTSRFNYHKKAFFNNKLYFMAMNSSSTSDWQLYSYDPANDVVKLEKTMHSKNSAAGMAAYGNKLYLSVDSNNNQKSGMFIFDGSKICHAGSIGLNTPATVWFPRVYNKRLFFTGFEAGGSTNYGYGEVYVLTDTVALNSGGEEEGVDDLADGNNVTVSPNPATDLAHLSFTLTATAKLHVQFTDMQGRVVYRFTQRCTAGNNQIIVPMKELATGEYIYALANEEGVVLARGKIMKQ